MSRFVLGNCIDVMARIPDNAIDFILTDPPYLVGFRDRQGRTIAGDKTDEWLQPACNEMYRVLKKDALMVSFYGWNRVDRFMSAWKNAGFSVVGRSCDDGADRWSGVVCRKIITPFLARGFFPGILRLSSGCAGRSGAVTGVVSLTVTG